MKTNLSIEESARLIELGVDCKVCHADAPVLDEQGREVLWEDGYKLKPNEFCTKRYIGNDWDMLNPDYDNPDNWENYSVKAYVFNLQDLLAILPKKITDRRDIFNLTIGAASEDSWYAKYINDLDGWDNLNSYQEADELCDCIYDMIVWLKEDKELTWL